MMKINRTSRFKKEYRQMIRKGCDSQLFGYVVGKIADGRLLAQKYNDHELKGNFADFRECHIEPDWLLIYLVENDILILTLTRTGTYADSFKK